MSFPRKRESSILALNSIGGGNQRFPLHLVGALWIPSQAGNDKPALGMTIWMPDQVGHDIIFFSPLTASCSLLTPDFQKFRALRFAQGKG